MQKTAHPKTDAEINLFSPLASRSLTFSPKGAARFINGPGFQRLRLFVNVSQLLLVDGCALEVTEDIGLFRVELLLPVDAQPSTFHPPHHKQTRSESCTER